MRLLLSFLGTGAYQPTTYVLGDRAHASRYATAAMQALLGPDRTLVAATEDAAALHGGDLAGECAFDALPIPGNGSEADVWTLFERLAEAVPPGARLLVDITHGFRSQPFVALAVALYLRAARGVVIERVVYGAFEARGADNRTPVFDLTPFVDLVDWAQATGAFLESGDAGALRKRLHRMPAGPESPFRELGTRVDRLTAALAYNRPAEALAKARELPQLLAAAAASAEEAPASRPLLPLLDRIGERFGPLAEADGDLMTDAGFRAQAAMIQFYEQTGQPLQALTLAEEALVSRWCTRSGGNPWAKRDRQAACDALYAARDAKDGSAVAAAGTTRDAIRRLRNDMAHAGMDTSSHTLVHLEGALPRVLTRARALLTS